MPYEIVEGDLLKQPVEAIVNPWNRNTIPWWLLLPQGVSGAIKRRAGAAPFKELCKFGRLKLGEAVSTGAGNLPFRRIIHVAGINDLWRASERSVRDSMKNALALAKQEGIGSLAVPLIGAGSGSMSPDKSMNLISDVLKEEALGIHVLVVVYRSAKA